MDKPTVSMPRLIALLLCLAAPPAMSAQLAPPSVDILSWPRMTSPEFGCYMEKTFGYKDKRFNCSLKHYKNKADVCKHAENYYEGPAFPEKLVKKVHPLAERVDLSWEHGDLQHVSLTLKGTWNESEVRKVFRLPRTTAYDSTEAERIAYPDNLMDASVGSALGDDESKANRPSDPSRGETTVALTGFDHMGGGDVDCEDDK